MEKLIHLSLPKSLPAVRILTSFMKKKRILAKIVESLKLVTKLERRRATKKPWYGVMNTLLSQRKNEVKLFFFLRDFNPTFNEAFAFCIGTKADEVNIQ